MSGTATTPNVDASGNEVDTLTMYQILTGVLGGLALILMITTLWLIVARKSGHVAPAPSIQGGFSLGNLGSLMSTS